MSTLAIAFITAYGLLSIAGFVFFFSSRNAQLKRKALPVFIGLSVVLFLAFIFTLGVGIFGEIIAGVSLRQLWTYIVGRNISDSRAVLRVLQGSSRLTFRAPDFVSSSVASCENLTERQAAAPRSLAIRRFRLKPTNLENIWRPYPGERRLE